MKLHFKNKYCLLTILVILILVGVYIAPVILNGDFNTPPAPGDGPDYDAIAFQIAHGKGFSYDWNSLDFRAPYLSSPGAYIYLFQRSGTYLTAYRPPFLPMVMAGIYLLFGRQFSLVRLFNCLAMAVAGGITFQLTSRRLGAIPGLISSIFFILDDRVRYYAPMILTESIACLFIALIVWSLFNWLEKKSYLWIGLMGIFTGMAILNRSIFIFFLPILFLMIYIGAKNKIPPLWDKNAFFKACFYFLTSILIIFPWMVRNCIVVGNFSPLGTEGGINLPGGYSDQALENKGVWSSPGEMGILDGLTSTIKDDFKLEIAEESYAQSKVVEWISKNYFQIPKLFYYKIIDLWQPRTLFQLVFLFLVLVGAIFYPRLSEKLICLGFLLINSCAVGLTWGVGDRFSTARNSYYEYVGGYRGMGTFKVPLQDFGIEI